PAAPGAHSGRGGDRRPPQLVQAVLQRMTDIERNKATVTALYERGFTGGDEAVFGELYAPGFVHHSKSLHDTPPGGEGERVSMLAFRQAMPDARFDIVQLVA